MLNVLYFLLFPPSCPPPYFQCPCTIFTENNAQWHWGGTNSSNIRTGSRCPCCTYLCRYNNNTTFTFTFIFFVIYHLHLCFTFRFMFADDSGTAGDRWVRVFFIFPQQRVSQLIFLPLADKWEVGGSGRSGAAAAARPGQRYVRVIANCLFIFDIVSHIIICLSPHPQADRNENGKQEVGGGSRVVGGGEGHGGRWVGDIISFVFSPSASPTNPLPSRLTLRLTETTSER